ncbi:NAD(P)/FAD-dependent oxidoreductase [bacterium]|nr:NAD(P)/FAD-dependent oxidoreductase [bacterium]
MEKTKYLIIGNSAAAINAIEAIRERDKNGSIFLVSEETCHTYSRPLISYYLGNKVDEARMLYRPPSFYEDHDVRTCLGKRVVHLDVSAREAFMDDQTRILFDKLLIATGGAPFVPELPGADSEGVFTFTTLDDARHVKMFVSDHCVKKAVVIGGGLIGLKVTEALIDLSIQVTIVELSDRILSATFDRTASGIIERGLMKTGCSCITCNTVEKILKGKKNLVNGVVLKEGTKIDCGLVIMAIGVRPRLDLVRDTVIKINRGIMVDEYLKTSAEDIYAAGDVVETYDLIAGSPRPIAILPNAAQQGRIAGTNMAGGDKKYTGGIAMNSIEIAGIPTISVGLTDPAMIPGKETQNDFEILQEYNERDSLYKKVVIQGGRIIGIILAGKIDRAGIYTGLIKDRIDVSQVKDRLLKDDFGLLSLPKEYRKHLVTGHGIEV